MANMPVQPDGHFDFNAKAGPIATIREVAVKSGGNLAFSLRPTIGIDIGLYSPLKQNRDLVSMTIKLSTEADFEFGVAASAGTSCTGIDLTLKAEVAAQLSAESAISAWTTRNYTFNQPKMRQIYHDCLPFRSPAKRAIYSDYSLPMDGTGLARRASSLDIPDESSHTCAFSTSGVYCADDEASDVPDPNCDLNTLPTDDQSTLVKRGGKKDDQRYCEQGMGDQYDGSGGNNVNDIKYPTYYSSSELVRHRGIANVKTCDALNTQSCNDFDFGIVTTPQKPRTHPRRYASEHVLEAQMLPQFFWYFTK